MLSHCLKMLRTGLSPSAATFITTSVDYDTPPFGTAPVTCSIYDPAIDMWLPNVTSSRVGEQPHSDAFFPSCEAPAPLFMPCRSKRSCCAACW